MNYVFTNGYWHAPGRELSPASLEPGQVWGRIDGYAFYSTVVIDEIDHGVVYVVTNDLVSACYGLFFFLEAFGLIVEYPQEQNEK